MKLLKNVKKKNSDKFERVSLQDELRANSDGMSVFRSCMEHETLMSFYDDVGNYAFREWWELEGAAAFKKWMESLPEYREYVE